MDCDFCSVEVVGLPRILKLPGSKIIINKGVKLVSDWRYNPAGIHGPVTLATFSEDAVIVIGEKASLSGSILCAVSRIEIGRWAMLGVNTKIYDTDFHCCESLKRRSQKSVKEAPFSAVTVGDDVWIGADCLILKGVEIGSGSVIAARAVVTKSCPSCVIVAGMPARIINKI